MNKHIRKYTRNIYINLICFIINLCLIVIGTVFLLRSIVIIGVLTAFICLIGIMINKSLIRVETVFEETEKQLQDKEDMHG